MEGQGGSESCLVGHFTFQELVVLTLSILKRDGADVSNIIHSSPLQYAFLVRRMFLAKI